MAIRDETGGRWLFKYLPRSIDFWIKPEPSIGTSCAFIETLASFNPSLGEDGYPSANRVINRPDSPFTEGLRSN